MLHHVKFMFFLSFREAGDIRSSLPDAVDLTNDSHTSFLHVLRNLYKSIILTDLDYALDKKVEQDLWNVCFKIPIAGLQPNRGKKTTNPLYNWFLEGASGFYMVLLQEICAQCDLDSSICKRNIQLAIFAGPSYAAQPKNESFLYICQHCLIHLGDLARYRNLLGEAESYYKHAIGVEPSSGHPYNQLALLESARGDTLSTLYYYVRSLALRHPFPPARINLEKLLKKQLAQMSSYPKSRGGRLSADEFLFSFLKVQGQIGLHCEFDQAELAVNLLSLSWPSLVATETLSPVQLIRMLTITLYMVSECSGASATDAQKRSLQLAVDVATCVYNACLTACCSLPDEQLTGCRYLSVIKLVLDWIHSKPEVLIKIKRGQLWSSTAKLLNQLQICFGSNGSFNSVQDDGKPLPEDVELLEFAPLRPVSKWPSTHPTREDEHRIRASRIVQQGKWLAEHGSGCLAVTHQENGSPEWSFTSLRPDSPIDKPIDSLARMADESAPPKEIKILARPPQRNVALAAILKHKIDDDPPKQQLPALQEESTHKQVSFQHVLAPPLPPVKTSTSNYPRPSLPPRLERLKAEQKDREQTNNNFGGLYSSFGAASTLPDLSHPPPPVPPPGLGFPPPPAAWSMAGNLPPPPPSIVPPYSLFNSTTTPWHPGQLPSFPTNLAMPEQQRNMGQLGPASLWSGPGPSPLERLLEQQKATRGIGSSPSKK